jgi:hypothetical protein
LAPHGTLFKEKRPIFLRFFLRKIKNDEGDDLSDQSGGYENVEANRGAIQKALKPPPQEIPGRGPGRDVRQENEPGQILGEVDHDLGDGRPEALQ